MNPSRTNINNKNRQPHQKRPLVVPSRAHLRAYTLVQASGQASLQSQDKKVSKKSMSVAPKQPTALKLPKKIVATTNQPRVTVSHSLGRVARQGEVLSRAIQVADNSSPKKSRTRGSIFRKATFGVALTIVIAATGYVSIDTWLTNRKVEAQFVHASSAKDDTKSPQTKQSHQDQEGKDETAISAAMLNAYTVPAKNPRILSIDKINVKARLMPMGTNGDGSLQAPINVFDAGWYTGSSTPGQGGAVVIDAHASGPTRQGLFAYLDTLKKGDKVTVEAGSGKGYTYRVVATETVPRNKVDMQKLMLPYGAAIQGLNLITCTGKWEQGSQTYDQRAIVYTERVQ